MGAVGLTARAPSSFRVLALDRLAKEDGVLRRGRRGRVQLRQPWLELCHGEQPHARRRARGGSLRLDELLTVILTPSSDSSRLS